MNMSPATRKLLLFASSCVHAVLDAVIHQVILSLLCGELAFEFRVFMSGVIVVSCWSAGLYGLGVLSRTFTAETRALVRSGLLVLFLNVLFAVTTENPVPLSDVIMTLAVFFAVSFALRCSLRSFMSSTPGIFRKIISLFTASPAQAHEGPEDEIDTSLRKDYRYNMRAVLRKKSKLYRFVKRAFDVVSSGCALVLLSPLLLVTAVAIKLEDGGSVLYSAERWGENMRNFRMYKFRSMKVNADALLKDLLKDSEMTGHAFKIKDDPRITRVGHFIRKYSIDELPQLWNIFVGEMSIVGPRPIITLNMDTCDDYDKQRWLVQPGLTCYWQVSGRANIKWAQWVEMDLDYIEKMSITEDIKLILKTFPVVFKADGAY